MKNSQVVLYFLLLFCMSFFKAALADTTSITRALTSIEHADTPATFMTKAPPPHPKGEQPPTPSPDAVKFTLKAIIITGNRIYSEKELLPLYESYLDQNITIDDLQVIVEAITKKYRENGYVLSYAILPEQEIEKGFVLLKIVEGYVSKYVLDDPDKVCDEKIKYYLEQILLSKPLHQDILERNLLLIRRLFGVDIQTTFTPSTSIFNATELVVKLSRKKINTSVAINNDQVDSMGPWVGLAQFRVNNITNHHDYFDISAVTAYNRKDLKAAFAKYEVPIGEEGSTFKIQGNRAKSHPSGDLEIQNIVAHESGGRAVFRKPLVLDRSQFFSLQGGVGSQNVKSTSDTGASRYTDKTRKLLLGMRYELSDQFSGANIVDAEVAYGVPSFGASSSLGELRSRARGTANFTKIQGAATRLQSLGFALPNLGLLFALQGQYAGSTLLTGERFGVGGTINRAYPSGSLTGDSGFQGRIELQYTLPFNSFFKDLMFYAFYSYGRIWNRAPSPDEQHSDSVEGVGGGARLNLSEKGSCYLTYGRPLQKRVSGTAVKDKLYFGLQYSL